MKKKTEVECLECGFKDEFELLTETIENVDVNYLECPSCENRIISFVADAETRECRDKVRSLLKTVNNKLLSQSKRNKAHKKYVKMAKEHRRLMNENFSKYPHLISKVLNHG